MLKPSSHSYLNSLTDHHFDQFLVMLVMFLSNDELIFLLLFETMISQSCKYVLRPPKPFNVSNFPFFRQLSRSFHMFVCLLGEKLPALASLSRKTRARPRAVGEYETCLFIRSRELTSWRTASVIAEQFSRTACPVIWERLNLYVNLNDWLIWISDF